MLQAFVMQLLAGFEAEYQQRHDEIWPELVEVLKRYGMQDYHIFLHPETLQLFGFLTVPVDFDSAGLKREAVMQHWWESMAPLMETLPNSHEPFSVPLKPVFYLP